MVIIISIDKLKEGAKYCKEREIKDVINADADYVLY